MIDAPPSQKIYDGMKWIHPTLMDGNEIKYHFWWRNDDTISHNIEILSYLNGQPDGRMTATPVPAGSRVPIDIPMLGRHIVAGPLIVVAVLYVDGVFDGQYYVAWDGQTATLQVLNNPTPCTEKVKCPTPEQWYDFWSMGDVNRDGYTNLIDANLIKAAYGSKPGDLHWDPRCDINQDGIVNEYDIVRLGVNHGLNIWNYSCKAPKPCLIATVAFGTPLAQELYVLRSFRDNFMLRNWIGSLLAEIYYVLSPPIAKLFTKSSKLKSITRKLIKMLIRLKKW